MRLVMTLLVRDAEDILDDNLRYHLAQGVDHFIVGDNGSVDGSLEILERYQEAGFASVEHVEGQAKEVWARGRTRLARKAHAAGADWVIHNDQDEFWWPIGGTIKEALAHIPESFGLVMAPRTEFVARPGEGSFAERLTVRETRFRRPPKIAHRPHPLVMITQPHPSQIWIERGSSPRRGLVGRPVRRGEARHAESSELELLLAPTFPIGVLHFPVRSSAQYERMVEAAVHDRSLTGTEEGRRITEAYEAGRLGEVYAALALDDPAIQRGIQEGWLTEDVEFRDYLAACPDPFATATPAIRAHDWKRDDVVSEGANLEADAMYALSRYLQTMAYRGPERVRRRRSEERFRRLARKRRRQLLRMRRSLWWRLRPRLPRRRPG